MQTRNDCYFDNVEIDYGDHMIETINQLSDETEIEENFPIKKKNEIDSSLCGSPSSKNKEVPEQFNITFDGFPNIDNEQSLRKLSKDINYLINFSLFIDSVKILINFL